MTKYYLAYGSNLNMSEMKKRCPFSVPIGSTIIPNYRLVFRGIENISFLSIEPCEGSEVPVGVYQIFPEDEANLDLYEGVPTLYSKETIEVELYGKPLEAIVYIMNPKYSYNLPSEYYLARCLNGYTNFNFDTKVLDTALQTTKDNIAKKLVK